MGILEKFRPQPRWKHPDPAVRVLAIYDLGPGDVDVLRALAREDAEARVRRAATSRLGDVDALADVARTDPDEDVRSEAVRGLTGLAAETDSAERATEIARHLVALGRLKEAALLTRANASLAVRLAVVDTLSDQKALGSVSRQAADGRTRLSALVKLTDADEILSVALKSEHTDAAVAALERVGSAESLAAVAQRARNKVAARRARVRLQQIDDAIQSSQGPVTGPMRPEDLARAADLLFRVEALVTVGDPDEARAALSAVRVDWAELQADTDLDAESVARFEVAREAAREAIDERLLERAAEAIRHDALAKEQGERLAIVEEIERLEGSAAQDRIAELKVAWDALPEMPSEYAASLTRRFQDASRSFEDRERRRTLAEAAAARLDTLAAELEQLVASAQAIEEVVGRWRGLRRDADVLREHASANPQAALRLDQAVAALEEKEQQFQALRVKQEQDNLRRLQQLSRQAEALATAETLTLKVADKALHDVRAALEARVPLPSKKDRQEIQARLEDARAKLGPKVQELREADDWQRWANVQVQEELCREMEALKAESNLEVASRRMREIQGRWKPVALAPRAQGEVMWRRFKAAQDEVFARTAAFVAAQHEQWTANLARKQALLARAEALADSTEWVKAAAEMQALQAEWRTIGQVSRGHEKIVWERFRTACDRFFTRRQEDLKRRKDEWAANLERKEALCASAEALADSTEWDRAAAEIKQLQTAWKTIGPVRKSKSEVVWQRFRTACDRFFDRFKHRDQLELQEKVAARDALIRELEALLPAENAEVPPAPGDLVATLHNAKTRWQQAPELPRGVQLDLASRYHQAVGRIVATWPAAFAGSDLDQDATRKRMEKLVSRVEELAAAQPRRQASLSPAELLAQQWRDRLAANTISGGKAEENDEARWRAAEQEVRSAQAQWSRLGPVAPEVAGPLHERFQRACRRFNDQRRRAS